MLTFKGNYPFNDDDRRIFWRDQWHNITSMNVVVSCRPVWEQHKVGWVEAIEVPLEGALRIFEQGIVIQSWLHRDAFHFGHVGDIVKEDDGQGNRQWKRTQKIAHRSKKGHGFPPC